MSIPGPDSSQARLQQQNRYDGEARVESEARHQLYLDVREHIRAGWDELPEGLTRRNLRDLAAMAKSRKDHRIHALCRQADVDETSPPGEPPP
jgi:hypothetical protein